jgi:hypothetical protein
MTETPHGAPVRSTSTATSDSPYSGAPIAGDTTGQGGYGDSTLTDTHPRPTPHGDESDSPSVKDKASESAEAGKQAAGEVARTATDQAKDVAQETKKQARDLMSEARSQLSEQAGAQHHSLVTNLRSLAEELSTMAQRSENPGTASDLVGQAGDRAHSMADWLDQREPGDLLGEARSFAQRRPGTFLLGAVAAGVVAGRLTRGVVAAHSDDNGSSGSSPAVGDTGSARHQAVEAPGTVSGTPAPGGYGTVAAPTLPEQPAAPGYSIPPGEGLGTGGVTS